MSEIIGYIFTALLTSAGYIAVAYYQRKAENERRQRILDANEAHRLKIEAEIRSKTLPQLVADANERLRKRRGEGHD